MKKSKLILTMYIGVITLAVASVSMSVAWFATSNRLFVNGINISLDTDRGLEISESIDKDYGDSVTHSDKDANGVFIPLTSAHSKTWTSIKKDSPIFYDESNCSEVEDFVSYRAVEEGYGYFSKKIYLLADHDVYVTIDPDKTFFEPASEIYNKDVANDIAKEYKELQTQYDDLEAKAEANPDQYKNEFEVFKTVYSSKLEHLRYFKKEELKTKSEKELAKDILTRLDKISDAMRFSLLIIDVDEYSYTIIDPNKHEATLYGGVLDNSVDQNYDTFLKESTNEWYERVYGEVSGTPVYDDPDQYDPEVFEYPDDIPSAFNARHKEGVKTFNLKESLKNGFEIAEEPSLGLDDFRGDKSKFHFPVYMDTPKEVIVSVYLEGWDRDSVNYTMGATFNADLTFKVERDY